MGLGYYPQPMQKAPPQPTNLALNGLPQLRNWYRTPLGNALELAELEVIRELLGSLFGYHTLMVSPPWQASPLEAGRTLHRWVMAGEPGADAQLLGSPAALPVATDSLDTILLPHTLDYASRPHEILREVDRCLVPEGHVLILGFNPYGLWGLWRLLYGWRQRTPWAGRFIHQTRLRDWLALLGFDTLSCQPVFFRPPSQRLAAWTPMQAWDRLAERGWPVPAAAYLLLARKRVEGMTPLRPRWRPRRSLLAGGLIEPSSRSQGRGQYE